MYREDFTDLSVREYQNDFIFKTFVWMVAGLLTTAFCALFTYSTGLIWQFLYGNTFSVLLIAELAAVLIFSFLFNKLPSAVVTVLFFGYAILNGLTLSVIFAIYQMSSIILLFMAGALLFGGFAAYGYRCKSDLTRFGPMLLITLIVVLIMSLINLFI